MDEQLKEKTKRGSQNDSRKGIEIEAAEEAAEQRICSESFSVGMDFGKVAGQKTKRKLKVGKGTWNAD